MIDALVNYEQPKKGEHDVQVREAVTRDVGLLVSEDYEEFGKLSEERDLGRQTGPGELLMRVRESQEAMKESHNCEVQKQHYRAVHNLVQV